jgi:hypothetical protein
MKSLSRFAVQPVLPAAWAKLIHFQAVLVVTAVFLRGVVALAALRTLEGDNRPNTFLASHLNS